MKHQIKHRTKQAGFTIVEMAVVVPILILIALAIFEALFMIVQTSNTEHVAIDLAYEKNIAMNEIESDVRLAPLFVATLDTNTAGQDPNEAASSPSPSKKWSYEGGGAGNRVLILREYSTSSNPLVSGREPVFMGNGAACFDPSVATNAIQTYNTIFFVQNQALYRRRVTDSAPSDHTCLPQYQQTSCPSGTSGCPADEVIATSVQSFDVHYYQTGDPLATELDVYSGPTPSLVSTARSAEIDLTLSRQGGSGNVPSTISLRMATLNQDATGGTE